MAEVFLASRLNVARPNSDARRTGMSLPLLLTIIGVVTAATGWSTDRNVTNAPTACPKECYCSSDSVNCSGASLDHVPVMPESLAKTWILDSNDISYIGRDSFGSFDRNNVEELTIRNNNLSSLESEAFQRLPGLQSLYLDGNRIWRIESDVFENVSRLETLSLVYNSIGITELEWEFLRPLVSLKTIDVSGTEIGRLHRIPSAFSSLVSLEELTMQRMTLNVTKGYFETAEALEIRTLDLSICVVESVDEEALRPLRHLHSLILENAVVSSKFCQNMFYGLSNGSLEKINIQGVFVYDKYPVEADLFHPLKNSKVRELNFAGNYVGLRGRTLSKLFHPLKSLRKLHLDDCDLVSIREETFHGLHDLKVLTLRRNLLSCVRESDCGFLSPPSPSHQTRHPMRHLETIDLSDNLISESESRIQFNASFPALVSLNLRRNRLRWIPVGMFGDLKRLNRLDLSENPMEGIEPEALSSLESLTHLELDGSRQLTRIRQDAFTGLTQLTSLSIRNSGLVHIHRGAFENLSHLEELRLRNNRLGQNHDSLTKVFIQKSNLKVLDLGENGLTSFPRELLSNGIHLRRLYLDSNRLSDCHPLELSAESLAQLEVINLSYNSLVDPSHSCFESLRNLKTVDLSSNPFYCSCQTQDLATWLQQSQLPRASGADYVCTAPDPFAGRSIFKLGLNRFDCYWKYGVMSGVLVCLLAASVVVILVLCFRRTRRSSSSSSSSICAVGSSSSAAAASGTMETGDPGCSMFLKSAPYTALDEEELSIRGGIEDLDQAEPDGFRRCGGHSASSGSQRDGAARQSAANKKSSKCNGFSRAKTRSAASQDEAAMQTCALVEDASAIRHSADGDVCHGSPCFVTTCGSDADHVEDAV